jgi:iron complex outermembrane receptor protein
MFPMPAHGSVRPGHCPDQARSPDFGRLRAIRRAILMSGDLFMRILMLLFVCAAAVMAQTPGTLTGTVVLDSSNEPLHFVKVLIVPLGRATQTDDHGVFRIENIPAGNYEVVAHLHSLTDERKPVTIAAGGTAQVEFRLRLAAVREQVTVTASGKEETTLETFLPASSLDTTDLTAKSATSLGEVIENEAGVAKRTFGPGTSRPVVRGFDGDRVLILQDGLRTGTLSSQSGDHGEPVDPNSIERVEIVRGPGTLLYEGNAIGGVVNVVSNHHQLHKEPDKGLRGYVTGLGGSNNNRRGGSGGLEYGIGNWLLIGNGGAIYLDDYKAPTGRIPNSASEIRNGSGGIAHYGPRAYFNVAYALQDGLYGIPFAPDEEEVEEGEEHDHGPISIPFRRHLLRVNGGFRNLEGPIEQVQLAATYTDWKHREREGDEVANRFFNKQFIYRGVFDQARSGRLSGTFGFWGLRRDYKAIGEEAITPPVNQDAFALFGVEQLSFEKVRLQFGARVERSAYDVPEPDSGRRPRSFTGASASVGSNFPLWKGGAFVANFTSSFRAPALEELYSFGPHAGNLTFEIGDGGLRRERGNGVDFSLRHQGQRFRAEANYFYYRLSDYVFLAPTGDEDEGFPVARYRQGTSRYRGFEGRLSAGMHDKVWLHLGLDTVNAQLSNPQLPLPRIPPLRGRVGLDFRFGAFSILPEVILSNRQSRVYELETPTAGYAAVNMKALYSVTQKHFLHLFGVNVFNATDRLYRNHLSFIKAFAPEMGRGVLFTYTMRFF